MSKCATWPVSLRNDEQMRQGVETPTSEISKKNQTEKLGALERVGDGYGSQKIFDNVISISMTLGKCPRKLGENTQIRKDWNKSCSFFHGFFKLLIWSWFLYWNNTFKSKISSKQNADHKTQLHCQSSNMPLMVTLSGIHDFLSRQRRIPATHRW